MSTKHTCDTRIHSTVIVGSKWQVVIPQDVRKLLNIQPGDSLMVITKHNKAVGMIKTDDLEGFMESMKSELATK